jgi:hypothetical protein
MTTPHSRLRTIPFVPAFTAFRQSTIGHCVGGDSPADQQNPAKEKQRIAGRRDDVIENRTDDQGQAGAQGKGDRHAGDRNGGYQKQVSEIENHSANERFHQGASACAVEIVKETYRSRGFVRPMVRPKRRAHTTIPHM